ncbi:MAG TPA: YciI family protein [bacterium]|nr:YciI family protein [bacterium]
MGKLIAWIRRLVAEYSAWFDEIRREGRVVMAHRVDETAARWLPSASVAEGVMCLDHSIGGFGIIRAHDFADAESNARASPHLRHGGVVEVVPIR